MRSYFHSTTVSRPAAVRRIPSHLSRMTGTRSQPTRTRAEHAAIAKASAEWEHEVVRGLSAFIGQSIPLDRHERLRVTHIVNLAEDETFAGWYNWRGVTNPDIVLLGLLEGGPDDGAR